VTRRPRDSTPVEGGAGAARRGAALGYRPPPKTGGFVWPPCITSTPVEHNCKERRVSIEFELKGPVGWVTLARPKAMNALNREMVDGMTERLQAWRNDPAVRVVVVTATGPAFCAGADLKQAGAPAGPGEPDFLDAIVVFFETLRGFPKPVIAAVNGLALAGGMEIVLACDFVIAAQSARFGDAHSNFGVFPGGGGAAIMPRKLPP